MTNVTVDNRLVYDWLGVSNFDMDVCTTANAIACKGMEVGGTGLVRTGDLQTRLHVLILLKYGCSEIEALHERDLLHHHPWQD